MNYGMIKQLVIKPEHDAAWFASPLVVHHIFIDAFVGAQPVIISWFFLGYKPSLRFVKTVPKFLCGEPACMVAVGLPIVVGLQHHFCYVAWQAPGSD